MTYMDFGCGNVGHFVLPGARLVGNEVKVYAVDILKKALEVKYGKDINLEPLDDTLEFQAQITAIKKFS